MEQNQSTEIVDAPMAMLESLKAPRAIHVCLRMSVTTHAGPASATAIPIPVPRVSVMQALDSTIDQLTAIATSGSTQAGQLQTASLTTTTPVESGAKPVKKVHLISVLHVNKAWNSTKKVNVNVRKGTPRKRKLRSVS